MPYLLISTQIRLECGPTIVGDSLSDPQLMAKLNAIKCTQMGNKFEEWRTDDCPRIVLDKLDGMGYTVISMTGVGQTCCWTLYKPIDSQ
ncbi:GTP cyclohydrolase 1 feedback regulatory protein-like [Oppia nitens]|uniref:GTP cyclohydrolase 1 feedback regulatory protein-like n=1 Tax=Oppia nitens TaxID=1686743 RepID=UPI0023DB9DFC|nr:GTP cyclohydrolase 1 feedback regulatory protein-like [Oppia nitens]